MTIRIPALAALLCLPGLMSGCASTVAGSATPVAAAPAASAETLPSLLLHAGEVGAALSGADMVVTRDVTALWDDSQHFAEGAGCLAVGGAAQRGVYADSGWTAMHGQILRETPTAPSWKHFATQAVVLFPSPQAAQKFFAESRDSWSSCANRDLTYSPQPAAEQQWAIGPVRMDAGVLAVSRQQTAPQRWSCQRALTVHGHVAVDVEACALDGPTTAAATIAQAIADRIGPA